MRRRPGDGEKLKINVTFESMATNRRPTHCLPNVPGKRTYSYMMSSVHWSIEMHRKLVTDLLRLFRNHVRIELHIIKGTIRCNNK